MGFPGSMKKIILHIVFLTMSAISIAQDTSYLLPVLTIHDSFQVTFDQYHRADLGNQESSINTSGLMSDILPYTTSGITRSSGPGKVTTYTKHGLPTEHTKVTWNNLELNSSLNGIVDFSTLPAFLISNKSNLGHQSPVQIDLHAPDIQDNNTQVLAQYGAYKQLDLGIKQSITRGNTHVILGGEYISANHNFAYKNDLNELVAQTNSKIEQTHGLVGIYHRLNDHSEINLQAMYSAIHTEIPPTIFQRNSDARQENHPFRLVANYQIKKDNNKIEVAYGNITERLQYINPSIDINATHKFSRNHLSIKWQRPFWRDGIVSIKLIETIERGASSNFSSSDHFINTEGHLSVSKPWHEKFIFTSTIGLIHQRSNFAPVKASLSGTYIINRKQRVRLSSQTLYRLPTFNELYWSPGGNKSLSPESGYALDIEYFLINKIGQLEVGATMHRLTNRILWQPTSAGYFSPSNVGNIGTEELYAGFSGHGQLNKIKLGYGMRYTYLSTHIIQSPTSQIEGRVLPFTPKHSISEYIHVHWKKRLGIKFHGKYQSQSFTTTENSSSLDAFFIARATIEYKAKANRTTITSYFTINNITNNTYFLTNGYPQPPRHWQAGCIIQLKK